jgi:integrase/recombinase XerD
LFKQCLSSFKSGETMASVNVSMYKTRSNSDGTYPVYLQIIIDRKPIRKLLFSIFEKDWDPKKQRVKTTNYHHTKYNELLMNSVYEIESKIIQAKIDKVHPSKEYLFSEDANVLKISDAIDKYCDDLRARKKFGMLDKMKALKVNILNFQDTNISYINDDWGSRFYQYLLSVNSENTATKKFSYLNTLRISNKMVPLKVNTITKKSTKDKLSKSELKAIEDLPLSGMMDLVRDTFVLSFYLRGRRIGDILSLKHSEMINGRVVRDSRKVDKNMDIKLVQNAQTILDKYKGKSEWYVLPWLTIDPKFDQPDNEILSVRFQKHIEAKTAVINKYLKIIAGMADIDKNLTTHVARHTFAYLADQYGMTGKRIQDMLEHSDLKTTENYIHDLKRSDVLDKTFDEFMEYIIKQ